MKRRFNPSWILGLVVFFFGVSLMANPITLMTWNIHKAQDSNWSKLLAEHPVDIYALQEAISYRDVFSVLDSNNLDYIYNPAWEFWEGRSTGTLTASNLELKDSYLLISQDSEPITMTPKSTLITDYRLKDCAVNLRVINVHMINFNVFGAYDNQLEQIRPYISNFKGAVVLLGDFNNWNFLRSESLFAWTEKLNLKYLEVSPEGRFNIDHIFYKNLKVQEGREIETSASDHNPLLASFTCS